MDGTNTARTVWECANGTMYRAAYEILGNRADAEDAVMDAMCRIVRNEDKFAGLADCDIRALAAIYARRTAIDIYRKNRRKPYPMDDLPEEMDFTDSPEAVVTAEDSAERLLRLIGQMPPSYRDVLLLRVRYGMSDREIAETLGIHGGTVRTRMSRARTWLEKKLAEKEGHPDE
ncbi:MAG: sigma-70 family RNA polymerase sigma factor [Ruminococcaceae bacterium]|nr:sigma-70 family RNA polymerase sigma factor [Oscillospiraceae bacterium]